MDREHNGSTMEMPAKKICRAKEVYVLHLKSGAKYVGKSDIPKQRFLSHKDKPNSWVQSHGGPERLDAPITKRLDSASDWEEKETWLQMLMHGPNLVRGAQYSLKEPLNAERRTDLARTLCQHADACFKCGRLDCSVSSCRASTKASWLSRFVDGDGKKGIPAAVQGRISAGCSFSDAMHIMIEQEDDLEFERVEADAHGREIKVAWAEQWRQHIPGSEWEESLNVRGELQDTVLRVLTAESWEDVFACEFTERSELWLLDCTVGNMHVEFIWRSQSSYLLDFHATWPHGAVQAMERITFLLHVDDAHIWAVNPRDVRQEMVHVGTAMSISEVENCFTTSNLERLRADRPPTQSEIKVLQDPPGSGKTYNIVCIPFCPEKYPQCDTFIYITKPHSAKEVVHQEFKVQLNKQAHVKVIQEQEKNNGYWKKLDVDGREKLVFFITGDSLFSQLGARSSGLNVFEGICRTIYEEGPRVGDRGAVWIKGQTANIYGKTLVCMDEATKFTRPYAKALGRIVFQCNSNAIIAGDYLQSIETKDNVLVYALETTDPFPGAKVEVEKGDRIRRCGAKLVDVIKKVVPWEKYKLPLPEAEENMGHETEGDFIVKVLSNEEDQETKIEGVLRTVQESIEELCLLPNDILCIFLFVSKNHFGDALRDAMHSLWRDLLDDNTYRQRMLSSHRKLEASEYFDYYNSENQAGRYVWLAHFHRSEEGRPIQTKDSIRSTRMVSVHAAQGDGRRLALVFGLNEMGIKQYYTRGEQNIQYYSFVNVACSRAKLRTIAFQGKIYDDIWKRFVPYMDEPTKLMVEPILRIASTYPIDKVSFQNADEELVRQLHAKLSPHLEEAAAVKDPQPLVDFEHHQVRAATFHLSILLRILADEQSENGQKKHVLAVLKEVSRLPVSTTKNHIEYHKKISAEKLDCIPLLDYARKPCDPFAALCADIRRCLEEQQGRVCKSLKALENGKQPGSLFEDALMQHPKDIVALMYAIECTQRGKKTLLKMDAVYDIFKSFTMKIDSSLSAHYSPIALAKEVAEGIIMDSKDHAGNGEWQVFLRVGLGQQNGEALPDFKFSGIIAFVYATDDEVIVIECRPQIGSALLDDLSSTLLGYVALLQQPTFGKGANHKRFFGKRLSFLLVSMCTGWRKYIKGFEDLYSKYKREIYEAFCCHAKLMCNGFHDSVLDFHKCCYERGEPSLKRFRELKDATDKSKRAWAPQYVEDSLFYVQKKIARSKNNGEDPLQNFGCAELNEELDSELESAVDDLRKCLAPPPAAS